MPRLSAEARATATAARAGRLSPSAHLSSLERIAWRKIVAATPAGHLSERDRPLVESYVGLTVAQRKLAELVAASDAVALLDPDGSPARALDKLNAIGKTLAGLSNRLKIAPLATHSAPHKAGQRDEQPAAAPLLGGMRRVK